jgi:Hemerythrin HHE cation binding domain
MKILFSCLFVVLLGSIAFLMGERFATAAPQTRVLAFLGFLILCSAVGFLFMFDSMKGLLVWPLSMFKGETKVARKSTIIEESNEAEVRDAPVLLKAAGITYHPTLIDKLKDDHQELFAIYGRLCESTNDKRFVKIAEDLIFLRRAFTKHILVEDVRFYVYLENLLKELPNERNHVRTLKRDMAGISMAVSTFCEMWISTPVTTLNESVFGDHLLKIGNALTTRVELEEKTLYTLYVESL